MKTGQIKFISSMGSAMLVMAGSLFASSSDPLDDMAFEHPKGAAMSFQPIHPGSGHDSVKPMKVTEVEEPVSNSPLDLLEDIEGVDLFPSAEELENIGKGIENEASHEADAGAHKHAHGEVAHDHSHGLKEEFKHSIINKGDVTEPNSIRYVNDTDEYKEYVAKTLDEARQAVKMREIAHAAKKYESLLVPKYIPAEIEQEIYVEMAEMYLDNHLLAKGAAAYEKFLEKFPKHEWVPKIQLGLARLYRDMGAFKSAIQRYYDVIDSAVALPSDKDLTRYHRYSLQAQFEIADAYLLKARNEIRAGKTASRDSEDELSRDVKIADNLLSRLERLPLPDEQKATAIYRSAYAKYLLGDFATTSEILDNFEERFPNHDLTPEAYYLSAITLKQLSEDDASMRKVRKLLEENHKVAERKPAEWMYWKKKTGNQLANSFYEVGDYFNALQLYQALYLVDKSAKWQAASLYQMGLCFEHLGMFPKAIQAFETISEWSEWDTSEYEDNMNLSLIREMSQWRIQNLEWSRQADNHLRKLQ